MKRINGNGATITAPEVPISQPETKKRMLSAIAKSGVHQADRIVLYGSEGIGKTTFAAGLESPIFIPTEDGMRSVTVDAFPVPQKWHEIIEAVETLRTEEHAYKTLVIDTADAAERLCQEFILNRDQKKSIEDYGYGRGYVIVFEEFKKLLIPLDALRKDKAMNICVTAHGAIRTFNNPMGDNFDRWELKMDRRISALLKEWSDILLFAGYDVTVDIKTGQNKGKGYGGERTIYTIHEPAFDAKNRHGLPAKMPMDPAVILKLIKGGK